VGLAGQSVLEVYCEHRTESGVMLGLTDPPRAWRSRACLSPTCRARLRNLSPDARQAGHTAECGLCGEQVPLDRAWPDNRKRPCHPDCYADAFGAPPWYDGQ
jgi:hypothetical protein